MLLQHASHEHLQEISDDLTEQNDVEESLSSIQQTIESEEESSKSSYSVGLPIPGFEMDFTKSNKSSKKAEEPKSPVISAKTKKPIEVSSIDIDPNEPKVDKIITSTRPSRAEIKKMYISLILQEGAAPEAPYIFRTGFGVELHNFDPINTAKGVYFDMEFGKGFAAGFSALNSYIEHIKIYLL